LYGVAYLNEQPDEVTRRKCKSSQGGAPQFLQMTSWCSGESFGLITTLPLRSSSNHKNPSIEDE
jgi:hypothetical protein